MLFGAPKKGEKKSLEFLTPLATSESISQILQTICTRATAASNTNASNWGGRGGCLGFFVYLCSLGPPMLHTVYGSNYWKPFPQTSLPAARSGYCKYDSVMAQTSRWSAAWTEKNGKQAKPQISRLSWPTEYTVKISCSWFCFTSVLSHTPSLTSQN
jgi:hypothetical protein